MMTRALLAMTSGFAALCALGCGSSDSAGGTTDCGHPSSSKDLSVIDRAYDDVSGEMTCKDSPVEIYASASSDAPGDTGLVAKPSGVPIAQARTSGSFAEFSLPAGDYVVCLAHAQPSCGRATLQGKHVYGTFTGGPAISWAASDDLAVSTR
jgi:hypothetical protein